MSAFDFPVIDGIAPSWADIAVRVSVLGGSLIEIGDIAALNFGSTVEVGAQREGGRLIKRTTGSLTDEASWTLYASGYLKLIDGLIAVAPRRGNQARISLVHFNISALWTPPGSNGILEKRARGCRLLSDQLDAAEGNDAQQIEMALSPLQIVSVRNGVEVVLL